MNNFARASLTFYWILCLTLILAPCAFGQTSSATRSQQPDDEETGESILARERYFYTRRAGGPGKVIPEDAQQQALTQHAQLMKEPGRPGVDGLLPSWNSVNPNGLFYSFNGSSYISGRTNSITWDPSDPTIIFAASAGGGVWKSLDNGATWEVLTDHLSSLASGAIAADPLDPNILYLGTGELNYSLDSHYGDGLFKSTDAGITWIKIFDTYLGRNFSQIVVNPVNDSIVFTASNQNVFKSTDMGAGWSNTACGSNVNSLAMDQSNPDILYAAVGGAGANSIRKSTNGGGTWTTLTNGLPTTSMGRTALAIAPSNTNVIYASIASKSTYQLVGLYKSTDGGASWANQAGSPNYLGGQGWYANAVAVNPFNENIVAVGGLDVYVSTDGGPNLTRKSLWFTQSSTNFTHADIHFLGYNSGNLYCGSDGGVYRSTNDGDSWTDLNATLSTLQFQGADYDPSDPLKIVGGTQDNNIENTDDGGATWTQYTTGDGGYTVIDPVTTNIVYSQYVNGSVERSENGGIGFTEISPNGASGGLFYNPFELAPGNHNVIVFAQSDVWKTTSAGTATSSSGWTQIMGNVGGNVSSIGISTTDINKIYIGTDNGKILVTTNNGGTWTTQLTGAPYITDLAVDPVNDAVCYASFGGFSAANHVYKTTNNGATWINLTTNIPNAPVNSIVLRTTLPRMIFAGTDLGVYRSTNDGASWTAFNNGLPTLAVYDLKYKEGNKILLAATHGRGCFTYDLSDFSFGASPTTLAFGNVLLNGTKTDSISVTNTGSTTLSVTSVNSDNAEFSVTPTTGTIAPSATKKFYVTYHPMTVGDFSATLTFSHSGITSPDIVTLTGFGSTPKFSATPASMNFGTVLMGLTKQDSVTISNAGTVPLGIDTIISTNSDFSITPSSATIPGLGSGRFYVTYQATGPGISAGTLIAYHNALTTPDSIGVTGRGGVSTIQIIKLEDADGDMSSSGDRSPKKWKFSVYHDSISPGSLAGSGDSSTVTVFLPSAGTYIVSEADSGLEWSRINLNKQRNDTITISPGGMVYDTFINRKFSSSISVADKWNMISLPLIVADSSYTTLFPEAISSAFKYLAGYQFSANLSKGLGYWLKFSGTHTYTFTGKPVDSLRIDVRTGWNLIGTTASPVPTANIVQVPSGIITTPYFKYKVGYSITDTLFPGSAYWVKTSQGGQLLLAPGSFMQPVARKTSGESVVGQMSRLTVSDAGGMEQSLFIGAVDEADAARFEMPPRPDENTLDVRFSSNRIIENYHRASDIEYSISISSAEYPIMIHWMPGIDVAAPVRISWISRSGRSVRMLSEMVPLTIYDTTATEIVLDLKDAVSLPVTYALEQNFPNPFNPVTVIRYALPADGHVTLKVFNILGQELRLLVDEIQTAGYKSVPFDALNLPSGVYVYKLQSGNFVDAKKMVLIK